MIYQNTFIYIERSPIMTWLGWIISQVDVSSVFLFVVVLILAAVINSFVNKPKNLPPFPVTPYPFVGNIPHMVKNPRETVNKWGKQTNGLFSVYMGTRLTVFLSSYEVLKEALVTYADVFSHRPLDITMKCKGHKENRGVVLASGGVWRTHRSLSQTIFRQFGMGKNYLALKIQEEVNFYIDELVKFKGQAKDVSILTCNSISNNICSILLGKRFEYDDPDFREILELLNEFMELYGKGNMLFSHKFLKYIPGDPFKVKRLLELDRRFLEDVIGANINRISADVDTSLETDNYILAYLREWKKRKLDGRDMHMGDMNLEYNIYGLFVAGTDTTCTTLLWFMLYMIHYPEIQAKIYKEIVDVIGKDSPPQMSHKDQMNYLHAATLETMRIASVSSFGVQHSTSEDVTFRGYFIPKGTTIIPNLDSALLDEKVWKNPTTFNPGNFLDENGQIHIKEQFIPFSLGRRVCLGEPLAKMEAFLYMANILQRFELKPEDPNNLPPIESTFGATSPPVKFALRFAERV